MQNTQIPQKPKMILFDYGQTLINEPVFDGVKGTAAVMQYATTNRHNRTPQQVQEEANAINRELGRLGPARHLVQWEVSVFPFDAYLYESQGIRLSIPYTRAETIFWDAAAPGEPTEGIGEFLKFLKEQGIRTGVISNLSYSGKALTERINKCIPENDFEFILASSEYVFRKPGRRIFRLALEKADLEPQDVWYVGDDYQCDIVGAGNAGLFPVWYTGYAEERQTPAAEVPLRVDSWAQLREYLRGL